MSYNGIGLATTRGSATSGHIQTNLGHVKPEFYRNKLAINTGKQQNEDLKSLRQGQKANAGVLEHNRKRAIESKIFAFREELLGKGFNEDEVEEKTSFLRIELLKQYSQGKISDESSKTDSHAIVQRKAAEMVKIRNAFGISHESVEGNNLFWVYLKCKINP